MENKKIEYHVGELAEYFGVSRDTLRLYDKMGILSPVKNAQNGYRVYSRADFICLDYIMRLKSLNMPLEDIKMMINDCTIERAEAVMQVQDKILEDKIEELKNLQMVVRDYQKSFSKAIQNMGQITIEESETLIYKEVGTSMKETMAEFNRLTSTHVAKFTFVAPKDRYFDDRIWEKIIDPEVRREFLSYAITLVDDEQFTDHQDFPRDTFQVIPPQKCVHATLKTFTNRDYSDFVRIKDYIKENGFILTGNPMYRTISVRNNSQQSVDYYEFWAPIE